MLGTPGRDIALAIVDVHDPFAGFRTAKLELDYGIHALRLGGDEDGGHVLHRALNRRGHSESLD
jgi:hypothetical protein